jgi:hypothetical protein
MSKEAASRGGRTAILTQPSAATAGDEGEEGRDRGEKYQRSAAGHVCRRSGRGVWQRRVGWKSELRFLRTTQVVQATGT